MRKHGKLAKRTTYSILVGLIIAIVWFIPVYGEWHYSAAAQEPRTDAIERIGLLGNFEVTYTVFDSPNHSPGIRPALAQTLRAFFPFVGSESLTVTPRPGRIFLSLLLTVLPLAAFRRQLVYQPSD